MKWRTITEQRKLKKDWHTWFAFFPTLIKGDDYEGIVVPDMYVWLETYERRLVTKYGDGDWEYVKWERRFKYRPETT